MTLRCMIVDDEPYAIRLLAQHMLKITALNLQFECSNPLEALDYLKHNAVDLIFLDINMPHLNGLQLASIFAPGQKFIFTTAYSEHAVESYEKNALDYLLKPITFERFLRAVTKATDHFEVVKTAQVNTIKEDSFFIKSGKSFVQLALSEIVFIESQKDYVVFHSIYEKHTTLKTMKELEESLPPHFQRVHHSYIINTKLINKIEDNHVHLLPHRIPISEKYREEFLAGLKFKIL